MIYNVVTNHFELQIDVIIIQKTHNLSQCLRMKTSKDIKDFLANKKYKKQIICSFELNLYRNTIFKEIIDIIKEIGK